MEKRPWMKYGSFLVIALFMAVFVLELDAYARVGGGRSFSSKAKRS